MKGLLSILFFSFLLSDVPFLNEAQLKKQLTKNTITVVEFYAEWNEANAVQDIYKLNSCDVFRVNIEDEPALQEKYNIIVVPTIIIFKQGKELQRYQANLMFQMCSKSFSCKDIQSKIDGELMNKFR